MVTVLENLKVEGKIMVVLAEYQELLSTATRNLPNVQVVLFNHVSVYDILNANKLVFTKEALERLEEVLK
jgi:large subunit ribosomal protein L4